MPDYKVEEKKRTIYFKSGNRAVFKNVTWFNPDGTFLRFGSDEGYVLINMKEIEYIIIDGERVK